MPSMHRACSGADVAGDQIRRAQALSRQSSVHKCAIGIVACPVDQNLPRKPRMERKPGGQRHHKITLTEHALPVPCCTATGWAWFSLSVGRADSKLEICTQHLHDTAPLIHGRFALTRTSESTLHL